MARQTLVRTLGMENTGLPQRACKWRWQPMARTSSPWHAHRCLLRPCATLHPQASARAGAYDQSNQSSLLDQYEYAMYGKIYKWKQEKPKEAVCVPPLPHAPEAGRALPLITSRAPQPPPMTPLSPPAPQRGLRLLRRAADATARQRPAPAPRPVREAWPGRPADRPQYHAGGLVGSGLHTCSSKRAPAGWLGGRRKLRGGLRALAGLHACDGVPPS